MTIHRGRPPLPGAPLPARSWPPLLAPPLPGESPEAFRGEIRRPPLRERPGLEGCAGARRAGRHRRSAHALLQLTTRQGKTVGGRMNGLRQRVVAASVVALILAAAALAVALTAANGSRAHGGELSQQLVPAAATAIDLIDLYTAQRTSLRNYVRPELGRPGHVQPRAIPDIDDQTRSGVLVSGDAPITGQLSATGTAYRAWRADVAAPQLVAVTREIRPPRRRCRPIPRAPGRTCWPSARPGRACRLRSSRPSNGHRRVEPGTGSSAGRAHRYVRGDRGLSSPTA